MVEKRNYKITMLIGTLFSIARKWSGMHTLAVCNIPLSGLNRSSTGNIAIVESYLLKTLQPKPSQTSTICTNSL